MQDLIDFQRSQNVGARITGASVTQAVQMFDISKATVSNIID